MNTEQKDTNSVEETLESEEQNTSVDTGEGNPDNAADNETEENETADTENADAGEENADEAQEPFLVARYNKTDVPLSREKAAEWAQKGMHYEDKLEYLAAIRGTTVPEMLKKSIQDIDDKERKRLEEQFGDDTDTIDKMMKLFHEDNKAKYEKAIADQKTAEEEKEKNRIEKLGDEFIELQKSFPELKVIGDIPAAVIKDAKNMSLEHAYLKYLHSEHKKSEAAQQKQQEAAQSSAGSMSSEKAETDTKFDDFARGVWGN